MEAVTYAATVGTSGCGVLVETKEVSVKVDDLVIHLSLPPPKRAHCQLCKEFRNPAMNIHQGHPLALLIRAGGQNDSDLYSQFLFQQMGVNNGLQRYVEQAVRLRGPEASDTEYNRLCWGGVHKLGINVSKDQ